MSLKVLEGLGLSKKEIDIYELLLKNGEMLPGVIVKHLKLKRATVYKCLYNLEEKGLVSQHRINNKISFAPEPPDKLLDRLEDKVNKEKEALENLKKILPEISRDHIFALEKPEIKVFSGLEGLKEVYMDVLNTSKPFRTSISTDKVDPIVLSWLRNFFDKNWTKKQIKSWTLIMEADWVYKYARRVIDPLNEIMLLPRSQKFHEHSIGIYDDKVVFVNYSSINTLIAIQITHPLIANTMKTWFDLAWEGAKLINTLSKEKSDEMVNT